MVKLKRLARARYNEFTSVDITNKSSVNSNTSDGEEWELPDNELAKILRGQTEQEICEEIRGILKNIREGTAEYDDSPL